MLAKACAACSAFLTPTTTPPASVLCRICGDTIFITTGKPIVAASLAACAASVATPSLGTAIPYASQMAFASGAVSALRPAARAWSSSLRTAARSCGICCAPLAATRPTALSCDTSDHLFGAQRRDFFAAQAKLGQHLVRVLPQQRRALDLGGAVGHLDRVADRQVFDAGRMIDLDDGAAGAQRGFSSQFLHRQDRTAGNVVLVELGHGLEFGFGHGPAFDRGEDLHQARQPRVR